MVSHAVFINLDSRLDRREQMEAMLTARALPYDRISALTPADPGVAAVVAEFPGHPAGHHANSATHAAVWERIVRAADATATRLDGVQPPLTLVLEDDVLLHVSARYSRCTADVKPMYCQCTSDMQPRYCQDAAN